MRVFLNAGKFKALALVTAPLFLAGCSTSPPADPDNLCAIFQEKEDWHEAALDMEEKWGVPLHVPMAILYQESSFKHDALPPRDYLLGFIPWGRVSSAYGYSQAKTGTWDDYIKATGNWGADRDDFDDAMDFMGWFMSQSQKLNGVSKWDPYNQYLNYHEGWGGFRRKSYERKPWLKKVALKIKDRAWRYRQQYKACKDDLDTGWF
ncbi:hypothetical protein [Gallaecimonas sp. GXIMD4217]|uniref:transglycosylase SLT domain-containing protein n=1 Tax=Gallaecimonas sp. GXIMD4217 TaxID=3131927 RepID=UPI00311AF8F1